MSIKVAVLIGDAGESRMTKTGPGYLVVYGDRKVFVKENDEANPEDLEYALQVCRTFAQKGEKGVVA